jgi:diadenosine tetraphosphate (Ap4A) HIT family hydrolase
VNTITQENLRKNCPHCDPNSYAFKYLLEETTLFRVVCDVYPLVEGHILIIPKKHLSCIGEYPKQEYVEFLSLYTKYSNFIRKTYGALSTFEHGKIGQTVFHSHIHLLPFAGSPAEIIPEGLSNLTAFSDFSYLKEIFYKEGKYLFFSIAGHKWVVNTKLGVPGFFRDRFAGALGASERGNWKNMGENNDLMDKTAIEIKELQNKWNSFNR